ncbi:hypothetical protein ACIQVE_28920 [Pseudomonas sp. NPDC098747]|uniref:hypothetical protein n=1 Tax=Pseudomonas sp. NPDC098747 TaxID=3364487 RepID=UPI00383B658C
MREDIAMMWDGFWTSWLAFWLVSGPIVLSFVGILYSLYLGRYLDEMMEALKSSRFIYIWGPSLRKQGWFGCYALITRIAGLMIFSRVYIRAGEVDPVDIENFPPHLKRMLIVNTAMLVLGFIGIVIVGVLLEFR